MSRQRHNFLHVSKMEIDCLASRYGGKIILDIEGNFQHVKTGVEVPRRNIRKCLPFRQIT